jgi:endonuclease III
MSPSPSATEYVPLFQEELRDDPFWMLVACQLVNLTHWRQAEPVFRELRDTCDGRSWNLMRIPYDDLVEVLRPLGLQNRRAALLRKFAERWQELMDRYDGYAQDLRRHDIMKLPGCGRYAADSWEIFVEGNLDVETNDHRLNEYLEYVKHA